MKAQLSQNAADIIIPANNRYALTRNLLEGIYRHVDVSFHIYVIDNASTDETVDLARIYTRDITVVRNREKRSWGASINQGVQLGENPYLVFMSNGVEISHGWPGNMLSFLDTHPRIGAVGPLGSNPDDWQCVDKVREKIVPQIPRFLTDDLHERNRILNYHFHRAGILVEGTLSFFCVAFKRRTVETVGLLDEEFDGGEDGDYCRRLRKAGYVLGLSLDTYVQNHSDDAAKAVLAASDRGKTRIRDSRLEIRD